MLIYYKGIMQTLNYTPGQTATVILEVNDGYSNVRQDSLTTPVVLQIFKPDLSLMDGYVQEMTRLDTGLYIFKFVLPSGASAVGSYIVDISYTDPDGYDSSSTVQILVNAPYGQYGLTIG